MMLTFFSKNWPPKGTLFWPKSEGRDHRFSGRFLVPPKSDPRGPLCRKSRRSVGFPTFNRWKWGVMSSGPMFYCADSRVKSGLGTPQVWYFLRKTHIGIARQRKPQKSTFWSQGHFWAIFGPLLGVPFWAKRGPRGGLENGPKTGAEK